MASSHGPSIKRPAVYEALRRKGYGKAKAARISNGMWAGGRSRAVGRGRRR